MTMANNLGILVFMLTCMLSIRISCSRICFSCTNLAENEVCQHAISCPENEVCFVQKYRSALHETRYDVGCTYRELCKQTPGIAVGKRSDHSHVVCQKCCDKDVCNLDKICSDIQQAGTETCSSCSEIQNPASCNNSTVCDKDEICFLHKYITESGQQQYDLGCKHSSICPHISSSSSSLVGRRSSIGREMVCESCCSGQGLCNRDLLCTHTHGKSANESCTSSDQCQQTLQCIGHKCKCKITEYWNGSLCTLKATECADIIDDRDGVYTIFPPGSNHSVSVFCIMRGKKKWTVIQRRVNGSLSFDRNWNEYKHGFGSAYGEFWLGNENIHKISANGHHEISFYLEESPSKFGYANYSTFHVGDEGSKYVLNITGYSGNTSDALDKSGNSNAWANGMMFSTPDQDNDRSSTDFAGNCAAHFHGGWWYNNCFHANINIPYNLPWYSFSQSLKKSIVMLRRSP